MSEGTFADKVLAFFVIGADKNWVEALSQVEPDADQVALIQSRVMDILVDHGWSEPVGTFVGSYVAIKDFLPESQHEDAIEMIRFLKDQGRLVQLGRGRGKAIVVVNDDPVPEPVSDAPPLDADAALRAIRDSYLAMEGRVEKAEAENEDLRTQLASAEERIKQLYIRLDEKVPAKADWS